MVKYFTERPVLSTVVSILIVLLGLLAVTTLPVTEYPDIAPPTVQVNASYPGANAETVLESVVIPIEEQISNLCDSKGQIVSDLEVINAARMKVASVVI